MNKHILVAMDWKNRSEEELDKNRADADDAYEAAYEAAAAAYDAYEDADDDVKYWLNRYFEVTGEDREEYEKALEEMKK